MVQLRLFAHARETAGCGSARFAASTVGELLDAARERYGEDFATVLENCTVWVDGVDIRDLDGLATAVAAPAEVAVLPPVSGG